MYVRCHCEHMFLMERLHPRMNPRLQGDLGEMSAIEWLMHHGYLVFLPLTHSPDVDIVARRDGELLTVEVKTGTKRSYAGRWEVMICTSGGNQSWNGVVKRFSSKRCDRLFVLTGDGRRWFIPTERIDGERGISLGGPKYAEFEVEPGRPLTALDHYPVRPQGRDSEAAKRTGL